MYELAHRHCLMFELKRNIDITTDITRLAIDQEISIFRSGSLNKGVMCRLAT